MNFDGEKLRLLRVKKKLSQTDLATDIGTQQCVVSCLERNLVINPSFNIVVKLSEVLDVPTDYFVRKKKAPHF